MRIAASAVAVFRVILAVLATLYFVFALAILGMRYVVLPNLDRYLPRIETLASRAVGAPVRIDTVGASWYRLNPQLHLSGVRMLDAAGQPALALPSVDVLLSWRSMVTFRPELLRLQLHAPELEAGRGPDGTLVVAGLPLARTGRQDSFAENPAVQWLLRQRSIEIHGARLRWHDEFNGADPVSLDQVHAVLRHNVLNGTRFAIQGRPPASIGRRIDIRGEVRHGMPGLAALTGSPQWEGRLYAALEDISLEALQPWTKAWATGLQGRAAARAWVDFDSAGLGPWQADLAFRDLSGTGAAALQAVQAGSGWIHALGNAAGGTARADVRISDAALALPDFFEQARIPVREFSAMLDLTWQDAAIRALGFERLRLDAGEPGAQAVLRADGVWRPDGRTRAGSLELEGRLDHADVGAIARFMPLVVGPGVRQWLDEGLVGGTAEAVDVRLAGDLGDFPFDEPADTGVFRVSGRLQGVGVEVAPQAEDRWPRFENIRGQLLIDRGALMARIEQGTVREGLPHAVTLKAVQLGIPRLRHGAVLTVQGEATGPAEAFLEYVRRTPLDGLTGRALHEARATGNWQLPLEVVAPLTDITGVKVKGSVLFDGNALRLYPGMPAFGSLKGAVDFSETGASARDLRGSFLGGEFLAHGSGGKGGGRVEFKGRMAARELQSWGALPSLRHVGGAAAYSGTLAFDAQARMTLDVDSDLQGLSLAFPEPLRKDAAASWPMRLNLTTQAERQRRLQVSLPQRAELDLSFVPPAGSGPWRILRGGLGVSRSASPQPGFRLDVEARQFDLDAWQDVLDESGQAEAPGKAGKSSPAAQGGGLSVEGALSAGIRAASLKVMGYDLKDASLDATREGRRWKVDVGSEQVAGHIEWDSRERAGGAGSVVARFSKLSLDKPTENSELQQAAQESSPNMPDIDLVAEDFRWDNWSLGRLRVLGSHVNARQWALRELVLENADATFRAEGEWERQAGSAADAQRRMTLHGAWQIRDLGGLLERFDMPGVIAGGTGDAKGTLSWVGKPFSYDLPSLQGHFGLAFDKGRFLQAPSTAGRLLGILSLQSLARAATFQGGNLFESGFAWDTIRSDVSVESGVAEIGSFTMGGPSATAVLGGHADLIAKTQNLEAVIVPHIDASAAALLAGLAVNPVVGVGAFLTQWIMRQPLAEAFTYRYAVTGTWNDPVVSRIEK